MSYHQNWRAKLYQIIQYIKFLFRSNNQHGIHSPFVYSLVTKCFYNKQQHSEYNSIEAYRKRLLKNRSIITVQDFGAGSRVFKSNHRQIKKIAKTAGIAPKRAQLLFRLVRYFNASSILELGTSLGMATSAMSLGNNKANIITIEGCKQTALVAQDQFLHFKINNIKLINSNFSEALNVKDINDLTFDLIYIDGNHEKEATLRYFNQILSSVTNDSIMIFDDIHWSKGMTEAWETIKQNKRVTVTIDTFFWGLVSFRKEQKKQHFTVRV